MTFTIELTPAQAEALRDRAAWLGVEPGSLARAAIEEFLGGLDAQFETAAEGIITKNVELYKRLA